MNSLKHIYMNNNTWIQYDIYMCVCVYTKYIFLCVIIEFKRKRLWTLEVGKIQKKLFCGC